MSTGEYYGRRLYYLKYFLDEFNKGNVFISAILIATATRISASFLYDEYFDFAHRRTLYWLSYPIVALSLVLILYVISYVKHGALARSDINSVAIKDPETKS